MDKKNSNSTKAINTMRQVFDHKPLDLIKKLEKEVLKADQLLGLTAENSEEFKAKKEIRDKVEQIKKHRKEHAEEYRMETKDAFEQLQSFLTDLSIDPSELDTHIGEDGTEYSSLKVALFKIGEGKLNAFAIDNKRTFLKLNKETTAHIGSMVGKLVELYLNKCVVADAKKEE